MKNCDSPDNHEQGYKNNDQNNITLSPEVYNLKMQAAKVSIYTNLTK